MPAIQKVVKFLEDNKALKKGGSPWPTYSDEHGEQQRYQIDWSKLFPPERRNRYQDREPWPTDDDYELRKLASDIDEASYRGYPSDEELRTMASAQSWDTCAWYQPIHYSGFDWGIFIREGCIINQVRHISRFLSRPVPGGLLPRLIRASVYAYFLHEQYHHKVECLGLRLHVVDRKSRYLPYDAMVYTPSKNSDLLLEEALANADAFQRLWNEPYRSLIGDPVVRATQEYLAATFPYNPEGYRMARYYLTKDAFEAGENLLHGQMHEATLTPSQPTDEWEIATWLMRSMFRVTDNIWTIVPAGRRSILPTIKDALRP